jgi:hypothetical protein
VRWRLLQFFESIPIGFNLPVIRLMGPEVFSTILSRKTDITEVFFSQGDEFGFQFLKIIQVENTLWMSPYRMIGGSS